MSLDEACDRVSSVLGNGKDAAKLAGEEVNDSGRTLFAGRTGDCGGIKAKRLKIFSNSNSLSWDCETREC